MTTGDPLVVRGYMKPLPTLTKPLRSVDIATHEPAEALRERTDSCTVPAAGVVGEAMVAFVLADAYRRKFGGDHIDDVLRRRRRLQGADRVVAGLTRSPVAVVGFMGAGKTTAARALAQASGGVAVDADAEIERRAGKPIAEIFADRRRARVPGGRGAGHARAARRRAGAARGSWRSAAARSAPTRSAPRCATTW